MNKSYNDFKEMVDKNLLSYIPDISPYADILKESMIYSLNAPGKRLRPVLLLSACEMCNGDLEDAIPFAIAIEFIHTYSLIHDDLPAMDDDDLRRGIPTNHKVFGEANAILAGDGLLNTAFQIMAEKICFHKDNPEKQNRLIQALAIISKASGVQGMIAGQSLDISSEGESIDEKSLEFIHLNKTAALIKAPIIAGLHIADAPSEILNAMDVYAGKLGLAFQISDDILDVVGNTETLGKPVGSDEDNEKATYVSIFGLDGAKAKLKETADEAVSVIDGLGGKADFFRELVIDLSNRKN